MIHLELQNAASIAAIILTTEAAVADFDDKDEKGAAIII